MRIAPTIHHVLKIKPMNSKLTRYAVVLLLGITLFSVCSCSDKTVTTTADSAGSPAGWNGKQMKMGDTQRPGQAPKAPGPASN